MTISKVSDYLTIGEVNYELCYQLYEEGGERIFYNIVVSMKNLSNGIDENSEIKDITSDLSKVNILFSKITNGLATPMTLCYIIEDFLCAEYSIC